MLRYGNMGWPAEMLERIQDSKVRRGYEEYGILCQRYQEIPAETSVSAFPQFGLLGRRMLDELDSENYWPNSSSCVHSICY